MIARLDAAICGGVKHLRLCSRSIACAGLPATLATSIAIAIASWESCQANPTEPTIVAEIVDRIISDQVTPVDAFGYLGGLSEARLYQPHSTTDDPREEIEQAASVYGVDSAMMMSIAKVESDFNPKTRTGSYKGLFQLSDYEFKKYGDGSIWDARDNARAAAHMFLLQAVRFKSAVGHDPDNAERYIMHQQGIQGAIEHYTHPERVAWRSMCATHEGVLKGEQWCKRCIWGNLLPEWKRTFGSVDNISSGDFVNLWAGRIDRFADRFGVAQDTASISASPEDQARRPATVSRNFRVRRRKLPAHPPAAGRPSSIRTARARTNWSGNTRLKSA
jgi:Transglycosylase SLT domain